MIPDYNLHCLDPATRNWFLLNNTPVYVWAISLIYLSIVLLGPGYMRNRKPWNVPPWFIVVYNMSCVYMSLYMTVEVCIIKSIQGSHGSGKSGKF